MTEEEKAGALTGAKGNNKLVTRWEARNHLICTSSEFNQFANPSSEEAGNERGKTTGCITVALNLAKALFPPLGFPSPPSLTHLVLHPFLDSFSFFPPTHVFCSPGLNMLKTERTISLLKPAWPPHSVICSRHPEQLPINPSQKVDCPLFAPPTPNLHPEPLYLLTPPKMS